MNRCFRIGARSHKDEVLGFADGVFDDMSIGDHPDVIAAEEQSRADIAGAREGDLDGREMIFHAIMLSDGSILNRDGTDATRPSIYQGYAS